MSEPIDWLPDGAPYSPRFGDRYHSSIGGGLDQARDVFLRGCGLPQAWAQSAQWRILETGFGLGLNFLVTWAAWRADPARPRLLHFVATEAWPVAANAIRQAHAIHPDLAPLAHALAAQFWGLLPGVHRLVFDEGRVLLTLYIGDTQAMLRQQHGLVADAVYLDGFSPRCNPDMWSAETLQAVARCCRRGTRLATWTIAADVRQDLRQCGFDVQRVPGVPPKRDNLNAVFDPQWEPRGSQPTPYAGERRCLVIGAGLAGAGAAASLARRGWQVEVLDQAGAPAAGASGLPAGLFCPHVSPDDSVLSRTTRSGVRTMLQWAALLLREGEDWAPSGVLEHCVDGRLGLGPHWLDGAGADWSLPATAAQLGAAGLPASTLACWHARAGWVRPARLVAALLAQPGVAWRGHCSVDRLARTADGWQALDASGAVLGEAPVVLVAGGYGSAHLLGDHAWPGRLQPLRGQLSWGRQPAETTAALPPFPVNGHGSLVAHIPQDGGGLAWHAGSTFERGQTGRPTDDEQAQAHGVNAGKLATLLPQAGQALQGGFSGPTWSGVRCTTPDRVPIVGPVDAVRAPGLWASTAMGARGLTLALLCGELMAARLEAEPLPLEARLARGLAAERLSA